MAWYVPILIFAARIGDVSVGTVRTMLMISGHRFVAAGLGALEVVIWIFAAGSAIRYLSHPTAVLGYAGGFAVGVLVGMLIEEKLALGYRMVRVISTHQDQDVSALLREAGYRVTRVEGRGLRGPVEIAFLVIRRKQLAEVRSLVRSEVPDAFLSIERVEPPSSAAAIPATDTRFARSLLERIVVRK